MLPAPLARTGVLLLVAALTLAAAAGAAFASATSSDQPAFCDGCHEMRPYHDAWSEGPHKDVSCIQCHVEPGLAARMQHKLVALGEVKEHLLGKPRFPLAEPPAVPD